MELSLFFFEVGKVWLRKLSERLCGEKTVVAKLDCALLLITEGTSFLDLWKYDNSHVDPYLK